MSEGGFRICELSRAVRIAVEREDTPWYPTMRLYRQKTAGNWEEVIQRVADQLRAIAVRR